MIFVVGVLLTCLLQAGSNDLGNHDFETPAALPEPCGSRTAYQVQTKIGPGTIIYTYICVYIEIYTHVHTYAHICILYIYIEIYERMSLHRARMRVPALEPAHGREMCVHGCVSKTKLETQAWQRSQRLHVALWYIPSPKLTWKLIEGPILLRG